MASLLQALLQNESGGRNVPNVHQGTSSGQAQGYFQITTGTWNDFGGRKYASTPLEATYEQQADIASRIPLKRWDESTVAKMRATGRPIDPNRTLGENLAMNGESLAGGGQADVTQASAAPAAAFPYRLYGGATRPQGISGLNREFVNALTSLYQAAPPEVQRELGLASGFRTRAEQEALWEKSDKTGRTVARPGHSKHEIGTAADLYGFGLKNAGKVSEATKQWVHANAQKYGLYFPMSYEPWHIQLARAKGQAGPGAHPAVPAPAVAAAPGASRDDLSALISKRDATTDTGQILSDAITGLAPKPIKYGQLPAMQSAPLTPTQAMPMVDPKQDEMRRQMLALAMQRLNPQQGMV